MGGFGFLRGVDGVGDVSSIGSGSRWQQTVSGGAGERRRGQRRHRQQWATGSRAVGGSAGGGVGGFWFLDN